MPKELFNQPLITTPTQPDDNDRIALSTPGATGGKNILWSYFKTLLQGALDKIIFNLGLSNPTYLEGVMFYDDTKKAVSYYNDQPEVTVNLGQEVLIRVYNNSGSLISNGQIVYPTGTFSGVPTIDLADASEKAKCRLVAMATQDIPDSTYGFVTRLGSVGGLNTSALSAGWIYLSDIVPGAWTQTRPIDGSYEIIIGEVGAIHASEGTIIVDPVISQLTVEVTDTNGFPLDQKAATTISFVDGTRTFTIAPIGSEFHYYQTGDKFRHTTGQSVVITNVTGLHIIFFDELVLTAIALPTAAQVEDIVLNKCWVSFIYWNATDAKAIIVNDERHGISMSPAVHIYLHRTRGAQYLEGITPTGYVLGDGSSDTHAQFGFTTGQITDEDNETTLAAVASTTGLRYLYKTGASGIWTYGSNAGYSFPVGGTPLPQFNEFTGGAWQLTEVTSGNFMLLHIFASADITLKPLCVLGTAQYNSAALATAGAPNEIGVILAGLPAPEFVPIATFILECKTSLTNSVNARIVQTSEGEDYINWITQQIGTGSTPANHNNLAGLELAAASVTWGHIDDQAQTIAGVKTFASSPLIPTPTADSQAATKKYVDDNIGVSDVAQAWSASITFDKNYGSFNTNTHTQTGAISYSINWTGAIFGAVTSRVEISNGDTLTFPLGYININADGATGTKALNVFTPVADRQYRIIFECIDVTNQKYNVLIVDYETTSQLNAPVLSSATLDTGLDIDLVFTDTNAYPPEQQIEVEIDTVNTFDSGNEFSEFTTKDSTGYTVTCPDYETTYYFRVRAVGDGVNTQTSPWSNIESAITGSSPTSILMSDDFTGTTIDTGKWTEVDPSDVGEITQNNTLIGTFTGAVTSRANYLESIIDDTGESVVAIQFTISGVSSGSGRGNWWAGLWNSNDSNNEIIIIGSVADSAIARLIIRQSGSGQYDFTSAISINNTWKVLKNGTSISFYYLSAPDTWTQVGSTQAVSFGVTLAAVLALGAGQNGNVINVDDFYFSNADYSTSIPT